MCLYSNLIPNRRYIPNKKNGGIVPVPKDNRVKTVPIGCGKCIECCNQKKREWQVRLYEEIKTNKDGIFITLTFSNQSIRKIIRHIKKVKVTKKDDTDINNIKYHRVKKYETTPKGYDLDNAIATEAIRLFLERWRKKYKRTLRHWIVTELGHEGTENIHMHGIVWTNKGIEEVKRVWQYGFVWPRKDEDLKYNFVTLRTVNYVVKYISKQDLDHKEYMPKILTSAGIGKGYMERLDAILNQYNPFGETNEAYRTPTGHKQKLPIYYRNHIYSENEREALWIEKLDKQEMWVCGEKVDISEGMETYHELLKYYRLKNERLGYGDNKEDWSRKKYEEQRRQIMYSKRTKDEKANALEWLNEPTASLGYAASNAMNESWKTDW